MRTQTVLVVLVIAALLIGAGIYARSRGISVAAFIDAHR
jgi:hypothetical protein